MKTDRVFLLGDSHTRVIKDALVAQDVPVFGGIFLAGVDYERPFFDLDEAGRVVFRLRKAQKRLKQELERAGAADLRDLEMPVALTVGFNTNRILKDLRGYTVSPGEAGQFLSSAVLRQLIEDVRAPALAFYRALAPARRIAILSPQRFAPGQVALGQSVEMIFADILRAEGVDILDIRQTVTTDGILRPELAASDAAHGNAAYGEIMSRALLEQGRKAA